MGLRAAQIASVLASLVFAHSACAENRISGTYVSHGNNFAEMLQLTQTENGHLVGVMTSVTLSSEGSISSKNCQLTGATDAGQITLLCHYGLLDDVNLAGTVNWTKSEIQFQWSGADGTVASAVFERGAVSDFKAYTDQLRFKGNAVILTTELSNRAGELFGGVQRAEQWISNSELHEQRIPKAKEYYQTLEDRMRSLVQRERGTSDAIARSEISYKVNEGDYAGDQIDFQVEQLWDREIGNVGRNLKDEFTKVPSDCGATDEAHEARRRCADGRDLESCLSASVGRTGEVRAGIQADNGATR
jgi:hypothetical protein